MRHSRSAEEPLAAVARPGRAPGEHVFSFQSRGDRVRGRLLSSRELRGAPLVLLVGPDGCATSPWLDAAAQHWSDWAALAAIDLPLRGARASNKFAAGELTASLRERLEPELRVQARVDLARTVAALREAVEVDAARAALAASSEAAALIAELSNELALRAVLSLPPTLDAAWFDATGKRLREQLR